MYRAVYLQWAQDHEMSFEFMLWCGRSLLLSLMWFPEFTTNKHPSKTIPPKKKIKTMQQVYIIYRNFWENLDPFILWIQFHNSNSTSTIMIFLGEKTRWILRPPTWWSIVGNSHFLATGRDDKRQSPTGDPNHLLTGMILQLEAVDVSDIGKENSLISPLLNNSPMDLWGEKKYLSWSPLPLKIFAPTHRRVFFHTQKPWEAYIETTWCS